MLNKTEALGIITARLGYPHSETLADLWDTMIDGREAALIASLPGTAEQAAQATGQGSEITVSTLADLYQRGLVLVELTEEGATRYLPITNAGVLMDLVLFDRRYLQFGTEFLAQWRLFYNNELVHEHDYPTPADRPFRVVPVMEEVADLRTALPQERIADAIRGASRISVEHCPCRTREKQCDNPTETCLALDDVAEYMIGRGIGREIDVDEALAILAQAEELGLMHLTENGDHPRVVCNCCPCCCVFLRALTVHDKDRVVAASHYRAEVETEVCTGCGACLTRCHVGAMDLIDGHARVEDLRCLGCGLCVTTCPSGALHLLPRQDGHTIPTRPSGCGTLLTPLPDSSRNR